MSKEDGYPNMAPDTGQSQGIVKGPKELGSRRAGGAITSSMAVSLNGPPNHVVNGDASRSCSGKLDVPNLHLIDARGRSPLFGGITLSPRDPLQGEERKRTICSSIFHRVALIQMKLLLSPKPTF